MRWALKCSLSAKNSIRLQGNKQESTFDSLMAHSIAEAKCHFSYHTIIENNPLKTYLMTTSMIIVVL